MKKIFFLIILFSLLFSVTHKAEAQSLSTTQSTVSTFKSSDLPQWVKDIRRFDIIAFGIFPFSMFFVTTVADLLRWRDANNFNFSEEGRQYAPWPLKSAGAVEMTNDEFKNTIYLAAGVSLGLALIDLVIVNIKRAIERKRNENLPTGSYEINVTPYGTQEGIGDSAGSGKK
ncbi:hypothetical protein [Treponema sp. R6D11]